MTEYPGEAVGALCICSKCGPPWRIERPDPGPLGFHSWMALCPTCGNKRCPAAADHTNECSGSNEPGQAGSNYPIVARKDLATLQAWADGLGEDIDPASSGNDDAPDSADPVMQWGVRWPDGAVTPQRDLEAAHATAGFWASLDEPPTVVSRICGPWRGQDA